MPPQGGVGGYIGSGLANSFHDEDRGTGTLTSPEFTISKSYINFLVGGGEHAYDPTTVDAPPPAGLVYADFEGDTYGAGWTATGTFAGTRPPAGTIGDQNAVTGYEGRQLVNTFIDHDNGTGHISSPEFTITKDYINFLVGGGNHPYPGTATNRPVAVNLVVDGAVVRTKTGRDAEALLWTNWDVSALKGKTARIDIVDENTGGWGHINADQFTLRRRARLPALDRDRGQPARRRPGRAHHHRPQQRDARLARLERLRARRQDRPDPDRRPQHRRLGAHPRGQLRLRRPGRAVAAGPHQLARLRQGLLRRRVLERRARWQADHDRLDEQLALRRRDPDLTLAQRDERPARSRPAHRRRPPAARPAAGRLARHARDRPAPHREQTPRSPANAH